MALTEPVSMQVTGPVLKGPGGRGVVLSPLGACLEVRGGWHGLWVARNERAARRPCPADTYQVLCFHRRSRRPDRGYFQLCEPWGPCLSSATAAPEQPGR